MSAFAGISAGSSLGGQPVVSSSFTGNTGESDSPKSDNMLTIIIAVVGAIVGTF
jgi:hypothetical protein